ncbi:hypothetical protein QBC47DRAFT_86886 [Echria macrotheca]|uniref:Uncharacterized protein n=1 Tax=Echria macrotheca TaxID=438768 RepID=A0AAJ0B5J6_9PEZI|nr:hypothetical protein QBC47DRAFT_86886 [Echria macrotheca]
MEAGFRWLWVLLALFALRASADCTSYGVDYSNGGKYNIDSSSNQYFSFITVFQGCTQETINPVLVGPDGSEYACSAIRTTPAGQQVTSTCGIPFSVMRSGTWKIIVSGDQLSVQRTITLTVGVPNTVWVTATPTVVIGVTVTARGSTAVRTQSQTQTLILVPQTVTAVCNGATRTVTNYPQGPTVTVSSTVLRTVTDGQVTSTLATTVTAQASCHYPNSGSSSTVNDGNPTPSAYPTGFCIGDSCQTFGAGKGKGKGRAFGAQDSNPTAAEKRDVAATAAAGAVAAVTSTYTETTYTVTSTIQTTIPGKTTTEVVLKTVTATITPAPSTVCAGGGGGPGVTVTVIRGGQGTVTQTDFIYRTTHLSGTVWIGRTASTTITNAASATACWRAGGWFG